MIARAVIMVIITLPPIHATDAISQIIIKPRILIIPAQVLQLHAMIATPRNLDGPLQFFQFMTTFILLSVRIQALPTTVQPVITEIIIILPIHAIDVISLITISPLIQIIPIRVFRSPAMIAILQTLDGPRHRSRPMEIITR